MNVLATELEELVVPPGGPESLPSYALVERWAAMASATRGREMPPARGNKHMLLAVSGSVAADTSLWVLPALCERLLQDQKN